MEKLAIVLCAALVMGAASPTVGEIVYTPQAPDYAFGVGLYDASNPEYLNTVYVTSGSGAPTSAVFVFTFAAHMNQIFYNAQSIHFAFMYDNSSIEVVGASPAGPWVGLPYNYGDWEWPNTSHGLITLSSLSQWVPETSLFVPHPTSAIVPFFHVTLHVKSANTSQINQFGVVAMTLVSHTFNLTLTPSDFVYFGGAIHEIPEPASMTLLGGGLAALFGGLARRRRRVP